MDMQVTHAPLPDCLPALIEALGQLAIAHMPEAQRVSLRDAALNASIRTADNIEATARCVGDLVAEDRSVWSNHALQDNDDLPKFLRLVGDSAGMVAALLRLQCFAEPNPGDAAHTVRSEGGAA